MDLKKFMESAKLALATYGAFRILFPNGFKIG